MHAIRSAQPEDAASIADIYNHYILNTVSTFEEEPIDAAEVEQRIQAVTLSHPWIVCEEAGGILGYAYGNRFNSRVAYRYTAEVSIYLSHKATGRRIGSRLFAELISLLENMQLHSLIGGIALPNAASVGLHEKFGFEKVCHYKEAGYKFGKWIDVGYWQKMLHS